MDEVRGEPARFYDLIPAVPDDIPFYVDRLPSPDSRVLELGCGTGRVSIPLASHCAHVQGLDISEAMLQIGRQKVEAAGLQDKVRLDLGDISAFRFQDRFDFIIAPFRVLQVLELDDQIDGLFRCIKSHLEPEGRCILNAFDPDRYRDSMRTSWHSDRENPAWEIETSDGRVACYVGRSRVDAELLVLRREIVYRRFRGGELVDEAAFEVAMKLYYPDELTSLIETAGFEIQGKWGGYVGERYGQGTELVVEFGMKA